MFSKLLFRQCLGLNQLDITVNYWLWFNEIKFFQNQIYKTYQPREDCVEWLISALVSRLSATQKYSLRQLFSYLLIYNSCFSGFTKSSFKKSNLPRIYNFFMIKNSRKINKQSSKRVSSKILILISKNSFYDIFSVYVWVFYDYYKQNDFVEHIISCEKETWIKKKKQK